MANLTPQQTRFALQRFTEALAALGDIRTAANAAGVNYFTACAWSRDKRLQNALFEERQRRISVEGSAIAYAALREIVTKKKALSDGSDAPVDDPYVYPAAIRASVARDLMRMAGHTEAAGAQALDGQRMASLQDMTEDQLAAHIAEAQRLLTALPSQGDPPAEAPNQPDVASLL